MQNKHFPCKECIAYAACKNKLYNECSILYDYLDHTIYPSEVANKIKHRSNRAIAQKYCKALGFNRFIISYKRVFMFKSLGLTIEEEKQIITFLERNNLRGVF